MEEKIKRLKNAVIAIVILAVLAGTVVSRFPHVEDMRDKIQFFEYTPKESSGDPKGEMPAVEASADGEKSAELAENAAAEQLTETPQNSSENGKISLNKASKKELMTLPGIGETKANAIIEFRERYNGFVNTQELMQIKGIGEATYNKLKDLVTL